MRDLAKVIESYLESLRQIGRSSPGGIHWDRIFRFIVQNAPEKEWPSNPLILGGSIAPDADKHQRLREHLEYAAAKGLLFEAMALLERVPEDGWNIAPVSTWEDRHPWLDGDF